MKLELQKKDDYDDIWYVILIDGVERVWKRDLSDANKVYQKLLTKRIGEITVISSDEI